MGLGAFKQAGKHRGRGGGSGAVKPVDEGGLGTDSHILYLLQDGQQTAAEIGGLEIVCIQLHHGILLEMFTLRK